MDDVQNAAELIALRDAVLKLERIAELANSAANEARARLDRLDFEREERSTPAEPDGLTS